MKKLLQIILLLILATNNMLSQKIEITGIVIDSTKQGHHVTVVINDTLNKLYKIDNFALADKIKKDKNLVVYPEKNGSFKIECQYSDTLYFSSWRHITQSYKASELLKMKTAHIELEPEKCIKYIPCEEKNPKLYVFVGEKINVGLAPDIYYCDIVSLDSEYKAKYKVIENIYGNYTKEIIDFTSYGHFSTFKFADYQYVLLYVANYCNELIHVKYQFDELYKTKEGRWASPCKSNFKNIIQSLNVKPTKIEFDKPVEFTFKKENIRQIKEKFPSPYFEIKDDKVIVKYGFYPEQLFEIKKSTSLKDFGF